MNKLVKLFSELSFMYKFFFTLALVSLFARLYLSGAFFGQTDDWCYFYSYKDPVLASLYLIFVFIAVPFVIDFIIGPVFNFFSDGIFAKLVLILTALGIISAIAVPNFNRARSGGGFSAGGAKDIQNFRMNIQRGYLPAETDITYEGIFYDYYFDIAGEKPARASFSNGSSALFTPAFSWSASKNPLDPSTVENYLCIGLKSETDFSKAKRKTLNLVIVLDISGSMSSSFGSYYYDHMNKKDAVEAEAAEKEYVGPGRLSKLDVAARSIVALLAHLKPGDSLGIVLFDDSSYLAKPLNRIDGANMKALRDHILALKPGGGTNMSAGYMKGRSLLNGCEGLDPELYENRIIFLTDAMPNMGFVGRDSLAALSEEYSKNRIYTTFIGMGVDFQTELVEHITKVRGANYYSVHSAWEFKKRMDLEFDYMVNPLLFDLKTRFVSGAYEIEEIYGSPEANISTGELMRVNTLFPSPVSETGIKGGVILLKLKKKTPGADPSAGVDDGVKLITEYELRSGALESSSVEIAAPAPSSGSVSVSGEKDARKAVLLSRFVKLSKEWLSRGRKSDTQRPELKEPAGGRNHWERESKPLGIPKTYADTFAKFKSHFEEESAAIGDDDLNREKELIELILKSNNK